MTIFEAIEHQKRRFTKNDYKIYNYIKKFPSAIVDNSTADIIKTLEISQPAYTRFAQKLGFNGINEFVYQYSSDLRAISTQIKNRSSASVYGDILLQIEKEIDRKALHRLVKAIDEHKYVFLTGYNLSKVPAIHMDVLHKIIGNKTQFVSIDEMGPNYSSDSVIIIYSSMRGEAYKTLLSRLAKQKDRPFVEIITMNPKHVLKKYADDIIILPAISSEIQGTAVVGETLSFIMFNDILINELGEYKKSN